MQSPLAADVGAYPALMTAGRPTVRWQVGFVVALAIGMAVAGAVAVIVGSTGTTDDRVVSSPTNVSTTTVPTFVADDAGFSADFPNAPQRSDLKLGPVSAVAYLATAGGETVGVASAVAAAPAGPALPPALDEDVDAAAANLHGTVPSRAMTGYLGQTAEDAVINVSGAIVRVRAFYSGSRVYMLLGFAATEAAAHPNYDRLLATFQPR